MRISRYLYSALSAAVCAFLCACGTARVRTTRPLGTTPTIKPATVYVSDFEIDTATITAEQGILPDPPRLPGFDVGMLPPLPGTAKDPEKLARKLVDEMSASLVKGLTKAGLEARRLTRTNSFPSSGWLVRGVFTEVNQGNQLRRALIGFGQGKTDLQVCVDFNDLSQGRPKPFYQLSTSADSGKAPGAGPMIVFGPAGAAARFVIAGKDLDRNVKQTASRIAEQLLQRSRETL